MRGRPRKPIEQEKALPCRREGCENLASLGQSYCSRAHAPYGYYGLDKSSLTKWANAHYENENFEGDSDDGTEAKHDLPHRRR